VHIQCQIELGYQLRRSFVFLANIAALQGIHEVYANICVLPETTSMQAALAFGLP
jgi:hypothetical protein